MILFYRLKSFFLRSYFSLVRDNKVVKDPTKGRNLQKYEQICSGWVNDVKRLSNSQQPITFVYRLKNAEAYLELSVASIIPLANEIVFVDNGSTDNTKDVIDKIIKKYSKSVKFVVADYEKKIVTQGKDYSKRLLENPEGSLADYYNFSFSLASNKWVFKIDAHKVLCPSAIKTILKAQEHSTFVFVRGVDLHGRYISYEPLLYDTSTGVKYFDGDNFEYLDYKSHINEKDIYSCRVDKVSFLHLKSIINSSLSV